MNLIDNQLKHEYFAKEFYDELYKALENSDLKDFHFYIFGQLVPLISVAIDFSENLSSLNLVNIDFGYKKLISEGKEVDNIHQQLLFYRFKDRSFYKFKSYIYKFLISFLSIYYKNNSILLKVSDNELIETINNRDFKSISIFPFLNTFKNKNKRKKYNYPEIIIINQILIFYISKFKNNFTHFSPVKNLVSNLINNLYDDMASIQSLNWNKINSIFTSSGGNYINMLVSNIASKNDVKVYRAAHGGERIFFKDLFWKYELINVNQYIAYAPIYKNYISNLKENKIKISSISSNYYSSLFYNKKKNNFSCNSKILVIGQSYIGEARQFYKCKLMDHNALELENLVLKALIKIGKCPIYKAHPKGFSNKNLLSSKLNIELNELSLEETLCFSEIVIVTSISTATIEALLSRKKIIYIDNGLRNKSEYFSDLESLIIIIPLSNSRNFKQLAEMIDNAIGYFENNEEDYEEKLNSFYRKYFSSI